MRKRLVPVLIIAIGIAIFVLLRITRDAPEPVAPQERSWRVDTMAIEPGTLQPSLTLYGQLESPRRFTVVAPLAGRIDQLPVRDGQVVEEGTLLVALDEADIEPRLQQARAELHDAQAQLTSERSAHANDRQALELEKRILANARRSVERTEQLIERQVVSRAELEAANDALERAALTVATRSRAIESFPSREAALKARVDRARASLESTERDAQRSRFRAPFDGVVGEVQVAVGDQVSANAALLQFYPVEGMELRATLPQMYSQDFIQALAEGEQLVARTLDVSPAVTMTLQRIAGLAEARGVEAIFRLDDAAPNLRLGTLLAVSVPRPVRESSVAVPYSALYGNDTLYQLVDGRMKRLQVERVGETLREDGSRWVLVRSEQLQPGMRIVVTHLPNAVDGLRVDPTEQAPAGAAAQ
ncbi:HlyD family efflux transporter periplasmic adaptor subunit [Halopseudomonas nanhaiensis]|uniref:efflux RND transporter periplasmic adaptor subunit n=1 Tax=Halopseudomonas nanhaiensis TaxID=2830842 RepID=UPI001CC0E3AF|nr:biotin/lipoyl-binding protein [Halopseudomonas nanhaiensis]UAW98562.1 HlyD family efflux transporter periplasmic adaptor subunit [Halopseudomonas nanhaiensis]